MCRGVGARNHKKRIGTEKLQDLTGEKAEEAFLEAGVRIRDSEDGDRHPEGSRKTMTWVSGDKTLRGPGPMG